MRRHVTFLDFILREWLLLASAAGLGVTSLYLHRIPPYSIDEIDVLFLLAVLFVIVKGLENSGLMQGLSRWLERGRMVPLKLVLAAFFLSMVVTNDVSLVVVVPVTLLLSIPNKGLVVILEALAANAGSALTPFGNPQNLFIYWHYGISPKEFLGTMLPLALPFLLLLSAGAMVVRMDRGKGYTEEEKGVVQRRDAIFYLGALVLMVLAVLHLLPIWIGVVVLVSSAVLDRDSMKIDYLLLLTFFCFFGLAENLKVLLPSHLVHSKNTFLLSALVSQVISNVPAALLLANFTDRWRPLLWGTNVGGFGSIVGSMANLIAYKLYLTHNGGNDVGRFTFWFLLLGYLSFFVGALLYLVIY